MRNLIFEKVNVHNNTTQNFKMSKNDLATSMEEAQLQESLVAEHISNSNVDGLKKMIYKYQNRIKELHRTIQKHKKTNDQLKQQLKTLNQTLNKLINKIANKGKPEKQDSHKQDVVKKELQNELKKNVALKKQVEALRAKIKTYESQKIGDLHNQIREKDRVIQDLHQSVKLHQKFEKKEMNLDIYRKEQEAQRKINMLTQQVAHLRKKIEGQRKQHDIQERSMLFQSRKMKQLQIKQGDLQKTPPKNQSEGPKETYELLLQENKQLKEQIGGVDKDKKIVDKFHKGQLQSWKNKLKTSEKHNLDLKEQITKKDKQIHSLWLKIKSLSNNADTSAEEPAPTWIQLLDCRRELKAASNIRQGAKRFDDCQKLPKDKQYRIAALAFRFFQEHIVEMKITYEIKGESKLDKEQKSVSSFCFETQHHTKEVSISLSDYQYIIEWQVFLGKGIEYLKIRTSKQQIIEAGNQRNRLKCKRLPFDIKSFQKPIACYGITDTKNIGDKEREVLVGLGLVLKRKNVFGGRAHSLNKLEKIPSNSLMPRYHNDKNIS